MIDKFKTCLNCPDRTAVPNCHSTCEGYIARCKQNEERREKTHEDAMFFNYQAETILRCRNWREHRTKRRFKNKEKS